jgi:protein gp37
VNERAITRNWEGNDVGKTSIEWTSTPRPDGTAAPGYTFNPWLGCSKVAPGCTNCYAEADMDKRRGRVKWGPNGTRSRTSDAYWKQPLKWDREAKTAGERRRVFCASLADVFEDWSDDIFDSKGRTLFRCCQCDHGWAADMSGYDPAASHGGPNVCPQCKSPGPNELSMAEVRRELFALIDRTPNLDWLLLTKRPENIRRMWPPPFWTEIYPESVKGVDPESIRVYRENVWLLTSVSDQPTADKQLPALLACRDLVPVLGLSCEPLLGSVDLRRAWAVAFPEVPAATADDLRLSRHLHWVIVGGESGPHARPCHVDWVYSLINQCYIANVACFVKQLGAWPVTSDPNRDELIPVALRDRKGGDPDEWSPDLRVREFPTARKGVEK